MNKINAFFLMSLLSVSVNAADIENGDSLHADNCVKCHDSSVYTRANRRVTSMPKLGAQVRMCKDNLGITWFDDEVEDVTMFLNKKYYHF